MSILLALLIQITPTEVPLSKAEKKAASKIERKMNRWEGSASFITTPPICRTTKSTRDKEIDQLACEANIICITKQNERSAKIRAQASKNEEIKKTRGKAKIRATSAPKFILKCIKNEKRKLSIALAKKRLKDEQ